MLPRSDRTGKDGPSGCRRVAARALEFVDQGGGGNGVRVRQSGKTGGQFVQSMSQPFQRFFTGDALVAFRERDIGHSEHNHSVAALLGGEERAKISAERKIGEPARIGGPARRRGPGPSGVIDLLEARHDGKAARNGEVALFDIAAGIESGGETGIDVAQSGRYSTAAEHILWNRDPRGGRRRWPRELRDR